MKIRKHIFLLLLIAVALVFVGCGDSSDTSVDDSETTTDETSEKTSDEEESSKGGELKFAFNAQPPSLDPQKNTDTETRDITLHIYEPLLTLNSSLEVEPMLAESFEVSDDGATITFHLREGISFHNGQEMTAEDVIASMERWHELSSQAKTYLDGTEYEAVDEYTVVAHIQDPTTLDLYILSDMTQFAAIMPKDIVEAAGSDNVEEYIGTGPYQFADWKHDQYIHITRYDDYQSRTEPADGLSGEKQANVDDIFFYIVSDTSTRVAGLQSGEYDIAVNIPQDSADMLDSDPNVKNEIFSNSFPVVIFNNKSGPFADQKTREATNAAIDVEDLLIAGYGSDKYYEKDHALVKTEQTSWYTESGSDIFNLFDMNTAEQLLEESNYDGEEVILLTSRERLDEYNMMVVIQQQLESLGMNVSLEVTDLATILELREDENEWDIITTAFAFRPMPIQYLFLNPEWYGWTNSEKLKELSDNILYAGSPEDAQQYKDEFHEAFWGYLPIIKPGNKTDIVSMRENIDGLQYITGPIAWNITMGK